MAKEVQDRTTIELILNEGNLRDLEGLKEKLGKLVRQEKEKKAAKRKHQEMAQRGKLAAAGGGSSEII